MIQLWRVGRIVALLCLTALLLFTTMLVSSAEEANTTGSLENLALNKPALASSEWSTTYDASKAFDGNDSSRWSAGRETAGGEWIQVDLEDVTDFNWIVLKEITYNRVQEFELLVSDDGEEWESIHTGTTIEERLIVNLGDVQARYLRLLAHETNDIVTINSIELYYGDELSILEEIYFTDEDNERFSENETLNLTKGDSLQVQLKGMIDGKETIIPEDAFELESENTDTATIDEAGHISVIDYGVAKITGTVTWNNETFTTSIFVRAENPEDLVVSSALNHESMDIEIGYPSLINPGDAYPSIELTAYTEATVSGEVIHNETDVLHRIPEQSLAAGEHQTISIPGSADEIGEYKIMLTLAREGKPDRLTIFTLLSPIPSVSSTIKVKSPMLVRTVKWSTFPIIGAIVSWISPTVATKVEGFDSQIFRLVFSLSPAKGTILSAFRMRSTKSQLCRW